MDKLNFSIRISASTVAELDKYAEKHEWSRNYVIGKFLKEKINELATGDNRC